MLRPLVVVAAALLVYTVEANAQRSGIDFEGSVLSLHLHVGPTDQTQVSRLVHKVPGVH